MEHTGAFQSINGNHNPTDQLQLFNQELQAPAVQTITLLCIDGGGVRGAIPAVVLACLETELQKLGGRHVRLADFFHVIAGTSTGGLVTAMLTTPDDCNRPLFEAKGITEFYLQNCHKIFPPGSNNLLARACRRIKPFFGPKYGGAELRNIIREKLKQKRLGDALTNVVIPTLDIKTREATIFSTYQIKTNPSLNALLSDICIGTSAAPTYLPSHQFQHTDSKGNLTEFNLIDGGLVANNPVAISEVIAGITGRNPRGSMRDFRLVVLSVGTGSLEVQEKYDAAMSSRWGYLGWLTLFFNVMSHAQSNMADYMGTRLLQGLESEDYYLRIQATLTKDTSSMDDATAKNMENLVKAGEDLLTQPSYRMNTKTGKLEQKRDITNKMALKELAEMLYKEYMLLKSRTKINGEENTEVIISQEEKIDIIILRGDEEEKIPEISTSPVFEEKIESIPRGFRKKKS